MRVLLLPADEASCGLNRMIWPGRILAERGYDVEAQPKNRSLLTSLATVDGELRVMGTKLGDGFDTVVVQRPCRRVMVDALERLDARVVVELDDDLRSISAGNGAFAALHPKRSPEMNWNHLLRAIRRADALVVTTPALAERYGQNTPTTVVPNYVPEWYLKVDTEKQGNVFGWPGNLQCHSHDLQVTKGAIGQVMRETGAEFRVVGPKGVERLIPSATSTGWTDDYANDVSKLDVGIAPLEDSRFNRAKSWLKPLELAALGVPFVASATADYVRLFSRYGIGLLAPKPVAWKSSLTKLLTDPGWRAEQAENNRSLVAQHGLTYEERAGEFWRAWTS